MEIRLQRRRLEAARTAAAAQCLTLAAGVAGIIVATEAVGATDDEHDPEGHTIAVERQQLSALLAEARWAEAEAVAALARLDDGTYGACERCGGPIPDERLEVRPAARTCVPCATTGGRPGSLSRHRAPS